MEENRKTALPDEELNMEDASFPGDPEIDPGEAFDGFSAPNRRTEEDDLYKPEEENAEDDIFEPAEEQAEEQGGAQEKETEAGELSFGHRDSSNADSGHNESEYTASGYTASGSSDPGSTHSESTHSEEAGKKTGPSDGSGSSGKTAGTDKETGKERPEKNVGSGVPGIPGKASGQQAPSRELENTLARVQSAPAAGRGKKKATYKEKILRHKRRRYRRTVMLVLLAMLILTAGVILWMSRGYKRAELRRVAALSAEDGAMYENLGGNVVQYGGNGAICINERGDTLWTVSYEMQQPIVSVSGDVIAIANRNGTNVYVMNTDGLMGSIRTMLPIQNIAAARNGEVAVIMSDSRTTWVRLYTAKGREIAYLVRTMAENGYPIAAAISPDGTTLCLSSLQISSTTVKSNVSFYNFGTAGSKAGDHLVDYSDFIDEAVPYVRYVDDSTCVGVSDKRLILFRKTLLHRSASTNILFSDNVQGVFSSDNFTGLLFANTTGNSQYRLDLYNRRGKCIGSISFSMQFTDISIAGDKVYISNEHHCQIFTLGGRCLFDGELGKTIRALIPGARLNDLLVVTAGEVDNIRLH